MNAFGGRYRHSVIGLDGQTSAGELIAADVDWAPLQAPPKTGSWATIRALGRIFGGLSPDLVCTYNWGAIDAVLAASRGAGIPVLHHEDGFGADEARGPKRRRSWMRRFVLPRAAGVLVPSQNLARIATQTWKLAPAKVHHIPIGIRPENFPLADGNLELRSQLGIPPQAWVLGAVGHLRPEKNPLRLLRAFAAMPRDPPKQLLLLGEGPERAALEAFIKEHDLQSCVSLMGYQKAPAPFYQCMDCLGISSDTEQMPVNLLEAMAAGLPVVSTDVGDVRRMLPAVQADLITSIDRDSETATLSALTNSLARLLRDQKLARELGQANHAHLLASYSFEGMLAAFQGHYDAAITRG